jgi:hypothetical protein
MKDRTLEMFGPRSRRQAGPTPQWKVKVLAVLQKINKKSLREAAIICGGAAIGLVILYGAIILGLGAK